MVHEKVEFVRAPIILLDRGAAYTIFNYHHGWTLPENNQIISFSIITPAFYLSPVGIIAFGTVNIDPFGY